MFKQENRTKLPTTRDSTPHQTIPSFITRLVGATEQRSSGIALPSVLSYGAVEKSNIISIYYFLFSNFKRVEMCGDMGKAVLRALTGALLCTLVSDAAYLQVRNCNL